MKKLSIMLMLIMFIGLLAAQKFDPDFFQSKTILGCFTKAAVPNIDGKIDFTIRDGVVQTGLDSFDRLAQQFKIVNLTPFYSEVRYKDWNENGIYLQNTYRIMLDSDTNIDAACEALNKDPNLVYAELEAILRSKYTPNDPLLGQQYVHSRINSFDAWDYVLGDHSVLIGIADSGVKWNHPDLRANIWINPGESANMTINWDAGTISGGDGVDGPDGGTKIDDLIGWDFYGTTGNNPDNNPYQNYSANDHGTHVAGCAAAVGNNAIGVIGTAPNVSIISCKGASNTSPSTGIAFGYDQLRYCADLGADAVNASWGGPGSGSTAIAAVNYCTSAGTVVVTAAGNDNTQHTASYQDYPSDCPNALTVAATGPNDTKTSFSDYGTTIDVCAPGSAILSTIIEGNGYAAYDGTSMASPIVAGVVGLVRSMHPTMSATDVMDRIKMTADYIDDINPDYEGLLGAGRVNSYAATMYDKIPYMVMEDYNIAETQGDGDGIANPGETVSLKVLLGNYDPNSFLSWQNSTNTNVTLRCSYPGVTIIDSTAAYGTIFAGSAVMNNNDPFSFQTVSSLPSEPIPFTLVINSNPDAAYPYHKVIPIQISLSLVQQGWPFNTGGASSSSPILIDLDHDNHKESIFGGQSGSINCIRADGSTQYPGFPVQTSSTIVGSMAADNINSDPAIEFVASLATNDLFCINQDGVVKWTAPCNGTLRNGPVIANLSSTARGKVIAITQNGKLNVFNGDGTAYTNFPVTLTGAFLAPPAVADLNNDGTMEIIAISLNGVLYAVNTATGQNIAGFPVTLTGSGSQNGITIANLDSDTMPEMLIASSNGGYLYAVNHDGSVLFQKNIGQQLKTSPVVADIDNNNTKEIVQIANNGNIYIMNNTGADLPGTPIALGTAVECTPVVARFDGGNQAGIIFGDTNGKLHSVRLDGTESPNFPITIGGNVKVSAALADIDSDNDFDIVIPNESAIYVIDIKRPYQDLPWPTYLGGYGRTGNVYQATPVTDPQAPAITTALLGASPNPFNPSTTISFSMETPGNASIDIYNQKGQMVKSLANGYFDSGTHHLTWNGTDNSGRSVASGLYFFRMKSGKFSSTKKMVLMK